jgi:hypothetical protein
MEAPTGSRARLRKRPLFQSLGYVPHPGQEQVHRSTKRRRVLACGSRFGKTTAAIYECVAALLEPRERSQGWFVAPSYEITGRSFERVVAVFQTHFRHRVARLDSREIAVVNLGGGTSVLRAKSADRPALLLGEALDFLVVDEAARLKRDVWEGHLCQRLIDRDGWSLLISTPNGPGWFYEQFRLGQRGRDPGVESWSMPSSANPHLDRATLEAEQARLGPERYAQEFMAQFLEVEPELCEVCGGIDPDAPDWAELLPWEELRTCPACGEPVDEDGHTLVSNPDCVFGVGQIMPHETEEIAKVIAKRQDEARARGRPVPEFPEWERPE